MSAATAPPLNELDNPTVPLLVKGHVIPIRMDLNAMALVKEKTGVNLLTTEGLERMNIGTVDPQFLITAAWCCVVAVDANLTAYPALEDKDEGPRIVGGWFGIGNWFDLLKSMTLALQLATEDDEPPTEAEPAPGGEEPKNERPRRSRS